MLNSERKYTPPYLINQLRSVSSTVANYLDQELFKEDEGAFDYSIQNILNNVFDITIDELKEAGVVFTVDECDLIQDYYTAYNLVTLRKLLSSQYALTYFGRLTKLEIDELDTIIHNADDVDELLYTVVVKLADITKDDDMIALCQFVSVSASSNDDMVDTLSGLISAISESIISDTVPVKDISALLETIAHERSIICDVVGCILADNQLELIEVDRQELSNILREFDNDLLRSDVLSFNALNYISVTEANDTSGCLKLHKQSAVQYLEYWKDRGVTPSLTAKCVIVATTLVDNLYELTTKNKDAFMNKLNVVLTSDIFTDKEREIFSNSISNYIDEELED